MNRRGLLLNKGATVVSDWEKVAEITATTATNTGQNAFATYINSYIERPSNPYETNVYEVIVQNNTRVSYGAIAATFYVDSISTISMQGIRMSGAYNQQRAQGADMNGAWSISVGAVITIYKLKETLQW